MASPDGSKALRNGEPCVRSGAAIAALLTAAAVALRNSRHLAPLAALVCACGLTYTVAFWVRDPSGLLHFWHEVAIPALFGALAVTGLATLPGLPRLRGAVLAGIFAAALIALAITCIGEVRLRAAEAQRLHDTAVRAAAVHFIRVSVTDRRPDRKWVSFVESLASPSMIGPTPAIFVEKALLQAVMPFDFFDSARHVTSDLVYFARGYHALRRGDFPAAKGAFTEASGLYDLSHEETRYMLAYYAYAAANSGDTSAVEALLESMKEPEDQHFDYHLAKGVLAGLGGKHDEAVRALQLALQWHPLTDRRPLLSEHQYAEIVEWIFESTRKVGYRDIMLAWARANQKFAPLDAWPHAMIAKHSRDSQERRSAAAAAHFLDPHSERLATVDKMELEAANRDFIGINPLLNVRLAESLVRTSIEAPADQPANHH